MFAVAVNASDIAHPGDISTITELMRSSISLSETKTQSPLTPYMHLLGLGPIRYYIGIGSRYDLRRFIGDQA